MSEKDSVSSQDIPAVLRALGTLAVVAATAVAIKWIISRDKEEENESKIQSGQDTKEEKQSLKDDPIDKEIIESDKKETEVSNVRGMTILEFDCGPSRSSLDTCPSTVDCLTDHQRLFVDVAPLSCNLNDVGPRITVHKSEDANVSFVDDKINSTQNPEFSICSTQTNDEEHQLHTGESADVVNVKYQPIGVDNMASEICPEQKTINLALDKVVFNMDFFKVNGNDNCDFDMKIEDRTKPYIEENDNRSGAIMANDTEDNTNGPVSTCPQESVNTSIGSTEPTLHKVYTKQQTICTTLNMKDSLRYSVDVTQHADMTTITTSNKDQLLTDILCGGHSLDENLISCTEHSGMEHKICINSADMLEESNLNFSRMSVIPASAGISKEHEAVETNTLYDCHNGNQETSRDIQIYDSPQNHIQLLSLATSAGIDEWKLRKTMSYHTNHIIQWNTTAVYNSTEYIDPMYPLHHHTPEPSTTPCIEHDERQTNIDSLLTENSISICTERDVDVESPTLDNVTHDKPLPNIKPRDILHDPCSVNTFKSTMVTTHQVEGQMIKSTRNGLDNGVFNNWYKNNANFLTVDKEEFCTIITNGYFSRYQKHVDTNNFSCTFEKYKQEECCGTNLQSGISELLSNPLQKPAKSSCWIPITFNEDHISSSAMMDISKSQPTIQSAKMDPVLSEENMTLGMMEQTSDSFWSSAENLDNADLISKDGQDFLTSCTSTPSNNEELDKSLQSNDQERQDIAKCDAQSFSRESIMSAIAETPEFQSVFTSERKIPLMTKSCDNIFSGPSCRRSALKNKAQSMLCLLTEYYTTKLHSLENGPLEEVARGCFIRIPKGFQNIREGVSFQLTLGNCLELLKVARKNSVPDLLKAVYTLISDNYLNVLKNSAIYGQLTGLEREKILQLRMRGKLSLCIVETQSIFGLNKNISRSEDMSPDKPKDQLYSLDMESNQWKRVTNIPEEACLKGCSICSMHNYLFIAGGIQKTKNGLSCSNKLFCYNPLTEIWIQLTPMNQARSQLKLVPLDGYLYAVGGECLHTMEKYDPRLNKWTFVASLPKGSFAVAHEATACGGEIYISGGHLFYRLLKYNPGRDQWDECPFNASKGRSCDMVAVGHILYRFDMHKDSTVHIFKYNTTAKVWSEYTTTFPNSKVPFRCAVLDGSIYCLNRETIACFTVEKENAMFEPTMFSRVPTKGVGYPCPVVLSLKGALSHTSV